MKKRVWIFAGLALAGAIAIIAFAQSSDIDWHPYREDIVCQIGNTYETKWFKFNIISVEQVDEYAGYTAERGYQLYDVVIRESGIISYKSVPMYLEDFYMDADGLPEPLYALAPTDETMMPWDFRLVSLDPVEYHMVYAVPVGVEGLKLKYAEYDNHEQEGNTFSLAVN